MASLVLKHILSKCNVCRRRSQHVFLDETVEVAVITLGGHGCLMRASRLSTGQDLKRICADALNISWREVVLVTAGRSQICDECFPLKDGEPPVLQLLRVRRKLAVTGDDESLLKLWDLDRGECLQVCRGHTAGVHGVCVDWSSRRALSGSRDGTLMLWDLDCGACVQTMQDDGEWKLSVAMDWGAKRGLSGSRGGTLKLWDLDSAACLQTVRTGGGDVDCVAMHWSQRLALSSAHATFRSAVGAASGVRRETDTIHACAR